MFRGVLLPFLALLAGVAAHGAFERPSENERLAALGNLFEEPAALRALLRPDEDFPPIRRPERGDWLDQHREDGQTYEQFIDSDAHRPSATRRVLYLQPLGNFAAPDTALLEAVRAYAAPFFGMEARVLPAVAPDSGAFSPRVNGATHHRQWLSTDILAWLQARLPPDAFCLLGVTLEDLYPDVRWNYVFGQASLSERVGVYSFARYDPAFFGEPRPADFRTRRLKLAANVLAHETGHMFGLQHCIYFRCVMNGSNNLEETEATPAHLCPICLRKLVHGADFDAAARYRALAAFYRANAWAEEADWTARQLTKLTRNATD